MNTDFLKTLKNSKPQEKPQSENTNKSSSLPILLLFIAKYLAFYGAQWVILTKFNVIPFNILETLIIHLGIHSLKNYR